MEAETGSLVLKSDYWDASTQIKLQMKPYTKVNSTDFI